MVTQGAAWLQGDLRVQTALAVQLFLTQNPLDDNMTGSAAHIFHTFYFSQHNNSLLNQKLACYIAM
jgi:hypothetical protein